MCISGSEYVVYAPSPEGAILHRYNHEGDLIDSFGEPFGEPPGHPVQRHLSRIGHIACVDDTVFVITEQLPVVRAYRQDGHLPWTDTLPNFVQPFVQTDVEGQAPGTFAIGAPPGTTDGLDYNLRLRTVGGELVLAQSVRTPDATTQEPDPRDIVTTCLIGVADGTCSERSTGNPQVLAISEGVGVVLEEDIYPIVKAVDIDWGTPE
jgi:hypothetical protein